LVEDGWGFVGGGLELGVEGEELRVFVPAAEGAV